METRWAGTAAAAKVFGGWFCVLLLCSPYHALDAAEYSTRLENFGPFPLLTVKDCNSNRALGRAIGETFSQMINERLLGTAVRHCQEYANTAVGGHVVAAIFDLHKATYPEYWSELVGIAEGANASVEALAMLNLRHEILAAARPMPGSVLDACSAGILSVKKADGTVKSWLGHNEDGLKSVLYNNFFVRYIGVNISWVAFTYAGEIVSPAFATNSHGLMFTLNALYPNRPWVPGLGRNFVSRRLIDAVSIEDALNVIRTPLQSIGHSYNLAHLPTQHILNIESAPLGVIDVLNMTGEGWYFHANMYRHMDIAQRQDNSSMHRLAAANKHPEPTSGQDILSILGDTTDPVWPIYRKNDAALHYTFCTLLFDLEAKAMKVYKGNPKLGGAVMNVQLDTLLVAGPPTTLASSS